MSGVMSYDLSVAFFVPPMWKGNMIFFCPRKEPAMIPITPFKFFPGTSYPCWTLSLLRFCMGEMDRERQPY